MKQRLWRAMQAGCLVVALAACGGGGDAVGGGGAVGVGGGEPGAVSGVATIGVAGGPVRSDDGAQAVFPKDALRGDVTVRIAKDSTGAPPLPSSAIAAGAVYSITPHGGAFDDFVEVSIPVDHPEQAGNGQLLLVTAEPGDTQWRVLSGASYHDGKMRAPVLHFSFFQTIRLVDQVMPALVTRIDGANNVGGPGVRLLSALQDLPFLKTDPYSNCLGGCPVPVNTLVAELSLPAARPAAALVGVTPPTTCRPADLGHGAMSFRFRREGSQEFFPTVDHPAVMPRDPWPRFPGDGGALTFAHTTTNGRSTFPGFGAIHYYGNETPRIFGLYDANPPTQAQIDRFQLENNRNQTYPPPYQLPIGNVYALPPTGDNPADNLYTWGGSVWWLATQNGSIRIDTAIMTTCGLLLEAVPLTFKLNAPPPSGYVTTEFFSLNSEQANGVAEGTDVTLQFARYDHSQHRWSGYDADITSYRIDFSPDPTTVDWQPAPASAVTRSHFQFFDWGTSSDVDAAGVQLSLPSVRASQTGSYRVFYCDATGCFASEAYRLIVLRAPPTITAQPAGQTVQVGESASFTVATTGAPLPTIQWQKRSLLAAAFGFLAWTNIDGATSATYTTPPLTMGDTGTQYRAWANNALGGVVSDLAMLTVIERFLPPVIVAQPGNLNVVVGGTAVFAATVSGPGPLSFQWRRNGVNITGANSTILTLNNVTALNDGRYELVATNSAGSVTTEPGLLQVTLATPVPLAPAIAAPPASITVAEGNAANFAVAVTGTGPYSYQWLKAGVSAPVGSDSPSLSLPSVTAADAGAYSVRVTNNVGQVLSTAATLTVTSTPAAVEVIVAPTIVTGPIALAVLPGAGATFAVAVTGSAPLSYQWRRNGVAIAGATGAVLHIAAANALDAGQYAVEARNAAGAASSNAVPLIVIGAPVITQQPVAASVTAGQTAALSVAASGDGLLYQWTRNQVAIAGATAASYTTPALALADDGAVYGVVVYNGAGLVFSQDAVLTVNAAPPPAGPVVELAAGEFHSCARYGNGNVKCWGANESGELGLGDIVNRGTHGGEMGAALPTVNLGTGRLAVRIRAGGRYSCALLDNATVKCWGYNAYGVLGQGIANFTIGADPGQLGDALPPVDLGTGAIVRDIATGALHSCALLDGGAVKCWGYNFDGELGLGDTLARGAASADMGDALPTVSLGTGRTAVAVTAGVRHTCALLDNGQVKCWGLNGYGQLGQGNAATRGAMPAQMGDALPAVDLGAGRTAVEVLAGGYHTCARLDNLSVKCWGYNSAGQLGLEDLNNRGDAPGEMGNALPAVSLGSGRTALALSGGWGHTCALLDNMAVKCWGLNDSGQLGAGNLTNRGGSAASMGDSLPSLDFGSGRTVVAVYSGHYHGCVRLDNAAIKCWGNNQYGALGLGDNASRGDAPGEMGDALPQLDLSP